MGKSDTKEIKDAKLAIPILLSEIDSLTNIQNIMLYFLYIGELLTKVLSERVGSMIKTGVSYASDMCHQYGYSEEFESIVVNLITIRNKLMHCDMKSCYKELDGLLKCNRSKLTDTDKTFGYMYLIDRINGDSIRILMRYLNDKFDAGCGVDDVEDNGSTTLNGLPAPLPLPL